MSGFVPAMAMISADGVEPVTAVGVGELNELCGQHPQEILVVAPTEADLRAFVAELRDTRSVITLFPLGESSELAADWSDLPPAVAVRIAPPEAAAVVVVSLAQLTQRGVQFEPLSDSDVSHPVWEWLIRQTDRGCEIGLGQTLARSRDIPATRPRLISESADASRRWLLAYLLDERLIPAATSTADAIALRAGILQMHDFLDESHRQSQSVEGEGRHAAGDYWHAIMHRREPDYGNSKYWLRRVGDHPLFASLAEQAEHILNACQSPESAHWRESLVNSAGWDPMAFVDLCATCAGSEESPLGLAAREIQWQEMRLLLRHTYYDAIGS